MREYVAVFVPDAAVPLIVTAPPGTEAPEAGEVTVTVGGVVSVEAVAWKDLRASRAPEASGAIRDRVRLARERAGARNPGVPGFRNADLTAGDLEVHGALDGEGRRILETAIARLGLSVRAVHRGLRVARTIADLAESGGIEARHLAEALSYRAPALLSALPVGAG